MMRTRMSIPNTVPLVLILCVLLTLELEMCGGRVMTAEAQRIDCPSRCSYRCSKASRQNMCTRACNTCCDRCNCVPPGTSGDTAACPCYARMTTHGGRLKCP